MFITPPLSLRVLSHYKLNILNRIGIQGNEFSTITLLVLQMTPLMQIEKIALDHHIPIIISTQKKYSK